MPKVVDHAQRRGELAEALWRVLRREGVHRTTVRTVAAEAGCSPSALRHYFTTQDEMLTFAMRQVADRARARIAEVPRDGEPREVVERILLEVLPLDDERRLENEVWIAFNGRALVDAGLRAVRDETYDALRALCADCAAALAGERLTPARAAAAGRELNLLLDGLALHVALRPELWPARQVRSALRRYLDERFGD